MRSESAKRILENTPQEVKDRVSEYADLIILNRRHPILSLKYKAKNIILLNKCVKSIGKNY